MIPQKLNPEDEIRIIAPSSSLTRVRPDIYDSAFTFLKDKGFNVTFSKNCRETNMFYGYPLNTPQVRSLHQSSQKP